MYELKLFGLRMAAVLIAAPVAGWLLLRFVEKLGLDWQAGNRRKRWIMLSAVFIGVAGFGSWLRLADSVVQLGEERRLDPNFTPPDIAISRARKRIWH